MEMTQETNIPKSLDFFAQDTYSPLFWDDEDCGIGDEESFYIGDKEYSLSSLMGFNEWFRQADKYDPYSDVAHFTQDGRDEWINQGYLYAKQIRQMIPKSVKLYYVYWHRFNDGEWSTCRVYIPIFHLRLKEKPMPKKPDGTPDWLAVNIERAMHYIYEEMNMTRDEADEYVRSNFDEVCERGDSRELRKFWRTVFFKVVSRILCDNSCGQLKVGFNPDLFYRGSEIAVANFGKGFCDFAMVLTKQLGDEIRPYLKMFYEGVRVLPPIILHMLLASKNHKYEVSDIDVLNYGRYSFYKYTSCNHWLPIWTDSPKPLTEEMVWDSMRRIIDMQVNCFGDEPYESASRWRRYNWRVYLPRVQNNKEAAEYENKDALVKWVMNSETIREAINEMQDLPTTVYEKPKTGLFLLEEEVVCWRVNEEDWEFLDMYKFLRQQFGEPDYYW